MCHSIYIVVLNTNKFFNNKNQFLSTSTEPWLTWLRVPILLFLVLSDSNLNVGTFFEPHVVTVFVRQRIRIESPERDGVFQISIRSGRLEPFMAQ